MTVQQTIENALLLSPHEYNNLGDLYYECFISLNSEFKWDNGQLVSKYLCEEINIDDYKTIHILFQQYAKNDILLNYSPIDVMDNLREAFLLNTVYDVRKTCIVFKNNPFLLNEDTNLFNIPDDVQMDWLIAAKNFYDSLFNYELNQLNERILNEYSSYFKEKFKFL